MAVVVKLDAANGVASDGVGVTEFTQRSNGQAAVFRNDDATNISGGDGQVARQQRCRVKDVPLVVKADAVVQRTVTALV